MATRSTTSEHYPAPPSTRLNSNKAGRINNGMALHQNTPTRAMNPGPNMCTAPTGGTTTGKSVRNRHG